MRALLVTSVVVAGCGIGSYGDFRDQLATRWCDRQVRCGEVGATDAQQHCALPAPLALTLRGAVDVPTAIAEHRLIFHPDNAAECLDAVKHAPCDAVQAAEDFRRHCSGVVTAGVATGGTCWGDGECVGGRCIDPDCGGTCTAFAFPGGACVPTGGAPEMSCDPSVQFCSPQGTCYRKETKGGPCAADDECLFALVCAAGKCDDPPRVTRGHACDGTLPCADGLYCDASGICLPLASAGQPCAQPDACEAGATCLDGACAPWLDAGGACVPGPTSQAGGCPATQSCSGGQCSTLSAIKSGPLAQCTTDDDCADGLYCATGNYCYYVGGVNAACLSDRECDPELQCVSGACHTPGYVMCAPAM